MALDDYPVDVRADYPERSSRGWAVLTILLIKFLALIPHFFVLLFLGIAQFVVAFIAQFAVAFRGEYPAGMHDFVTGVLRWQTRVLAFVFSVNDRYPPFTLQPVDDYPVDVVAERPAQSSRLYAVFTIIVEVLFFVAAVWVGIWLIRNADTNSWFNGTSGRNRFNYNFPSYSSAGLILRQIAVIPHFIVLIFLGLAAFVLWIVAQWVILFVARFPRGMWDVVGGYVRWYTRVNAYALGLIDRYPPFTMSPSLTAPGGGANPAGPPPPPPPMTATWPDAPPSPPTPQAPAPAPAPPQPAVPQQQMPQPQPPQSQQPPPQEPPQQH